jgi:phosphotransferase system enzyme I (PtsI)
MLPTQTKDGKKITLFCNMEIPDELMAVNRLTSDGIGLFRTEFLFMERENLPEEEEQYQIYKKIADAIQPQPFIIRTIDVGGDKLADSVHKKKEQNPGLGMRGIRISLADLELFKKQIRAIIRANEHDNIKIMFPMISCVQELKQAKLVVQECLKELNKDEKQHPMPIGTMIEIPAAALNADILARECDFFSIGTNDLIQYTLAVDRDNETVATYYKPNNVAILRLIKNTINHAQKHNIPVSVCGEMASQPEFVPLLIGLGINELSVSPGKLLVIKKLLLELNYADEKKKIDNILKNIYEDEVTL